MCDTAGLLAADINSDNMTRIGNDNETMKKLAAVAGIKICKGICSHATNNGKQQKRMQTRKQMKQELSNER